VAALSLDDDRRVVVVIAVVEAGAGILLHVGAIRLLPEIAPGPLSLRGGVLDGGRDRVAFADRAGGVAHRPISNLFGDGLALRHVGLEDAGRGPAVGGRAQEPGEIGRVGNAGIHAVAA